MYLFISKKDLYWTLWGQKNWNWFTGQFYFVDYRHKKFVTKLVESILKYVKWLLFNFEVYAPPSMTPRSNYSNFFLFFIIQRKSLLNFSFHYKPNIWTVRWFHKLYTMRLPLKNTSTRTFFFVYWSSATKNLLRMIHLISV